MGSDEIELVSSQRIEYFRSQSHEFGRGVYDSSNRDEGPVNNIEGEEEEDDDDELEEDDDDGDGEIEGLVAVDENAKNKSSTGSVQSSSDKTNLQNAPSSFGSGRSILSKENGIVPSPLNIRGCYAEHQFQQERINNYENAITISDSDIYYTNMLQGQTSSNSAGKEIGGENGCRFNGGRDIALYRDSEVSLRSILFDPITTRRPNTSIQLSQESEQLPPDQEGEKYVCDVDQQTLNFSIRVEKTKPPNPVNEEKMYPPPDTLYGI